MSGKNGEPSTENLEEEIVKLEDLEEEQSKTAHTEKAKAARGVDSVTDYVEEKASADVSKAVSALESLKEVIKAETTSTTVEIKPEDVQLLIDELEILKEQAERLLRNHNGNLHDALRAYVTGKPF